MLKPSHLLVWITIFLFMPGFLSAQKNPKAVTELLNRIGGQGTSKRFITEIDPFASRNGKDVFIITTEEGKPCIKGSSILAITTGINWYLNHYAHINISWNGLTTPLKEVSLPLPEKAERRESTADYRYYLNYCTFSYSMAFWTWERWQQEIDWMALHGINMPLMLIGADVVWKNVLNELGYTKEEINQFIAGPGFQAWWLMNNQEGWGGPNRDWWYKRQEQLSKHILKRMRSLGMTPVLPGYSGMVPSNIKEKKGWNVANPGTWCYFQRPGFLLPTDSHFEEMAKLYYKYLTKLMGVSEYYSMDPFHEGGNTNGVDLPKAYKAIMDAMDKVNPDARWVIQSWNENPRTECLETLPWGKLIVLDLFSDGTPKWKSGYKKHDMVYCMLHNFGGRVGLHGRLERTISGYYDALEMFPRTMRGVGATPEGIETNPMLYDMLFELPWLPRHDSEEWLSEYVKARYGINNPLHTMDAWNELAISVYDCTTSQQGTTEPIICARPALEVNSVSTWSTSHISYNPIHVQRAIAFMLKDKEQLKGNNNYAYDLVDMTRQALTDYANALLKDIKKAHDSKEMSYFNLLKKRFMQLILDQDSLLSSRPEFMLGTWTEMAKRVTDEVKGTSQSDKDWMDWNARTQITVWGTENAANYGGLHDYSNREWSGLLKDFHYARWEKFFEVLEKGEKAPGGAEWYAFENNWTKQHSKTYPDAPQTNAIEMAEKLFNKYFGTNNVLQTTVNINNTQNNRKEITIRVISSDNEGGTVTISGLGNPATIISGDRIILQAQPRKGYRFEYWKDEEGNIVTTETNYSFIPSRNGIFKACFKKQ